MSETDSGVRSGGTHIATAATQTEIVESVVIQGDLSKLSPDQRVSYYRAVCDSLGLNPLTRPFDYITLNGKLTLYAKRDATDQLRKRHAISVTIVSRERVDDVYIVTARAVAPDGRADESTGAVSIAALKGDALANAYMKAETKAKRRVTLSIVGLGWLDETEIETVPSARLADIQAGRDLDAARSHPPLDVETAQPPPPTAKKTSASGVPASGELQRPAKYVSPIWQRLYELSSEAETLGLPAVIVDPAANDSEIIAAGKALKAAVDQAKAKNKESK